MKILKITSILFLTIVLVLNGCKENTNTPSSNLSSKSPAPVLSSTPIDSFIKLTSGHDNTPQSLDVATARYQNKEGTLIVDLIGAVHVAEKKYYQTLNQQFKAYDALLYELVGPKDQRPRKDESLSAVGKVQLMFADLLTLEHQLIGIDYQAKNFIHADSSFDDLAKIADERGETKFTIITGLIKDLMQSVAKAEEQNKGKKKDSSLDFVAALELVTNPVKLKQLLAKGLLDGDANNMLEGMSTLKPYILDSRNDEALNVLRQEISKGHKKIGIFYGAAHLKDFELKLFKDFGLLRSDVNWLTAWDLTQSTQPQKNELVQMIRNISALAAAFSR